MDGLIFALKMDGLIFAWFFAPQE